MQTALRRTIRVVDEHRDERYQGQELEQPTPYGELVASTLLFGRQRVAPKEPKACSTCWSRRWAKMARISLSQNGYGYIKSG